MALEKPIISVDTRAGSEALIAPLRTLGYTVKPCILDSADVAFLSVGVEHKKPGDLIQSFLSGRLAEQARRMCRTYETRVLIVEGIIKPQGALIAEHRNGHYLPVHPSLTWDQLQRFLMSLSFQMGFTVHHAAGRGETTRYLANLVEWWAKPPEQHKSLKAWKQTPLNVSFEERSQTEMMAASIKGVGPELAAAAALMFRSPIALVNADEKAWDRVPGIGSVRAAQIVKRLRGR